MQSSPPDLPAAGRQLAQQQQLSLRQVPARMVPNTIQRGCAPFECDCYGSGYHVLYILPEPAMELDQLVRFGKKRASNVYEQLFIGMGHRFVDENKKLLTVVTRILPICSPSRGPTHARAITQDNDTSLECLRQEQKIQNQLEGQYNRDEEGHLLDPFLDEYGPSEVVLYGHTHPNLGCFFSATDHRSNYSTPALPMVCFVCDPIRKDMKAMVGVDGEDMKVIVCRPKAASAPAPRQSTPAAPREYSVEDLWHRMSMISGLLLQKEGISGKLDCHQDRRGTVHMKLNLSFRRER